MPLLNVSLRYNLESKQARFHHHAIAHTAAFVQAQFELEQTADFYRALHPLQTRHRCSITRTFT